MSQHVIESCSIKSFICESDVGFLTKKKGFFQQQDFSSAQKMLDNGFTDLPDYAVVLRMSIGDISKWLNFEVYDPRSGVALIKFTNLSTKYHKPSLATSIQLRGSRSSNFAQNVRPLPTSHGK